MEPDETHANQAFFNKQNASLGEPAPNHMTQGLEQQQAEFESQQEVETPSQTTPNAEPVDEFVVVNEEDISDAQELEPEVAPSTDPVPPQTDPTLEGIKDTLGQLTELQRQQIQSTQQAPQQAAQDLDPEPELDYSDPDSVKGWTAWQSRESDRRIEKTITKYHQENVLPVQNLALNREHQNQVSEAKTAHGDRFDWARDEAGIRKVQEASPSLSVSDAFKHIDYNRMKDDIQNSVEKKAELANAATVKSGPSSTAAKTVGDPIQLVATSQDRQMAKNFDMPLKDWMKSKYQHEKNPGASLI